MRGPNNITCLSPWRRTSAIRSRLARIARPRFAASGLDRMSSAPQEFAMQVRHARVLPNSRLMERGGASILGGASAEHGKDEWTLQWNSKFRTADLRLL